MGAVAARERSAIVTTAQKTISGGAAAALLCLAGCTGRQNPGDYKDPGTNAPSWSRVGPGAISGRAAAADVVQTFTLHWNVWPAPAHAPTNRIPDQCVVLASASLLAPFVPVATVPCLGRWGDYQVTITTTNQTAQLWAVMTQ